MTDPNARGFAHTREQFQQLVEDALALARTLGASEAGVEVSEGVGLSVSVRKGEVENVERNRDKSLGITVYVGKRRGNASTSDFSRAALEQTVRAAHDIARFTAEDPAAGLPEVEDLAFGAAAERDLDLYHPWPIVAEQAVEIALRCEAAALETDRRITNSDGAGVSAQQAHFFMANSRGFRGGYASSRHSLSVAPIASEPGRRGDDMQRDAWYSSMRYFAAGLSITGLAIITPAVAAPTATSVTRAATTATIQRLIVPPGSSTRSLYGITSAGAAGLSARDEPAWCAAWRARDASARRRTGHEETWRATRRRGGAGGSRPRAAGIVPPAPRRRRLHGPASASSPCGLAAARTGRGGWCPPSVG